MSKIYLAQCAWAYENLNTNALNNILSLSLLIISGYDKDYLPEHTFSPIIERGGVKKREVRDTTIYGRY